MGKRHGPNWRLIERIVRIAEMLIEILDQLGLL